MADADSLIKRTLKNIFFSDFHYFVQYLLTLLPSLVMIEQGIDDYRGSSELVINPADPAQEIYGKC